MKKILLSVLIILTFSGDCFLQVIKDSKIPELTILYWNDFHARNTPYKVSKKDTMGNTISYFVGGTSDMLGYIKKFRDKKTLLLNGGDDFQGSPISSITRGKSQIELLNLYNLDAFVIGNHEFDYGQYSLDSALLDAKFNYLSANLYFKSQNRTFGKSYVIKKINNAIDHKKAFSNKNVALPLRSHLLFIDLWVEKTFFLKRKIFIHFFV